MIQLLRTIGAALVLALAQLAIAPALAETRYIEGEGGVPLAMTVTGPADGPEILFIHGLGMGAESFAPQFESDLAKHFRLVAFDLRGHAMSGKPWDADAYTASKVWAADVARVIEASGLRKPVIVGWSYGTLVAADYLREKGNDHISGLVLVSALGGFVPFIPPSEAPDPEILAQLTRSRELRQSPSFADQLEAVEIVTPMLVGDEAPAGWIDNARILGMMVPPYAQAALRKHPMDNGDLVPLLREIPVLVLHGERDPSIPPSMLSAFLKEVSNASSRKFDNAGHSPFAEQPEAFNRELARFVEAHWSIEK